MDKGITDKAWKMYCEILRKAGKDAADGWLAQNRNIIKENLVE